MITQEQFMKSLTERLNNKAPLKIDLHNGVILDLSYDDEIKAYRGYWAEEDMWLGIWTAKTFSMIINGEIEDVEIIL